MSDNEIYEALHNAGESVDYEKVYLWHWVRDEPIIIRFRDVVDLINRQKAENDGLQQLVSLSLDTQNEMNATIIEQKEEIDRLQADYTRACAERDARICTANFFRAEAIKEFAERLKATPMRFAVEHVEYYDKPSIKKMVLFIDDNDIDNLVKEMVGEDK